MPESNLLSRHSVSVEPVPLRTAPLLEGGTTLMGWRHDFIWILPPDAEFDEVDRLMRELRRIYRWRRLRDRLRYGPWT